MAAPPVRPVFFLCAVLLAIAAAVPAHAQATAGQFVDTARTGPREGRDALSRRIVRRFDFEERQFGNFEPMPMHWYRIQRVGFPHYTEIGFDDSQSSSPTHSLRIDLNGGSAGVVLQSGAIAATPGSDYLVSTRFHTDQLEHARVMMVGYFTDKRGQPISASRTYSRLTISNTRWDSLQLRLEGDHQDAAWIMIELLVLQPEAFPYEHRHRLLGQHEVLYQDVNGTAWFDDVTVHQLPRVDLASQSPTNIIRQPDRPRLIVTVRDLTGEHLRARCDVYDYHGKLVDRTDRPLDTRSGSNWPWEPRLPELGWYWADLQVCSVQGIVGRRLLALLWLPEQSRRGIGELDRFVINAEDVSPAERDQLPALMQKIDCGSVVLSVWEPQMTRTDLATMANQPDSLIESMLADGHDLTLSFSHVPEELARAAKTDVDTPLDLLSRDPQIWQAYLEAMMIRYGQQIHRWQIGRSGSDEAFWRTDMPALFDRVRENFSQFIAQPTIVVPWSAQRALPDQPGEIGTYVMRLPVSVHPDQIETYFETWPRDLRTAVTLQIDTLDAVKFDHQQRAEDLALRMLSAWRAKPHRIAIDRPWRCNDSHRAVLLPDPMLGVWTNVAGHLAERRVIGEIETSQGVECHILGGTGGGALVVWNREAPGPSPTLEMFLGDDQPILHDVWGNTLPLELRDGRHVIPLSRMPRFIENIDADLAMFRAGFHVSPAFAESAFKVHKHTLTLTNPWPRTISGQMRLTRPEHWKIRPRVVNFSIPGEEKIEVPIELTFPISELAGEKQLTAEIELDADRLYHVDLSSPITIGLKGVVFRPSVTTEPREDGKPDDLVIGMLITNSGEAEQSLYAFTSVTDFPREERIVANLKPGQTVYKRFRFAEAAEALSGTTARVGLRQMDGPAMLNQLLDIP